MKGRRVRAVGVWRRRDAVGEVSDAGWVRTVLVVEVALSMGLDIVDM